MKKKVHPEFAYQSRELGGQIDGILGDPPNKKNYALFANALLKEYTKGTGIEDVNMMSFALVDHLIFNNAKGLLAEAAQYKEGDAGSVIAMASCDSAEGEAMLKAVANNHPALARQAIITAFLFKNQRLWRDEDQSLDALAANDDGDDVNEDEAEASFDFSEMFDKEGDDNV